MDANHSKFKRSFSSHISNRQLLTHVPTTELLLTVRQWVERCTGIICEEKTFLEYLKDGSVLCKVIQVIQSGLIRRTNRVKSPFAYRDNILFFLEACHKLGLNDSVLFTPEDLVEENTKAFSQSKSNSQEIRLRKVCKALYHLGVHARELPDYNGPELQPFPLPPSTHQIRNRPVSKLFFSTQNLSSAVSQSLSKRASSRTNSNPASIRKVQSVVSLVAETSSTLNQAFAEVLSFHNNPKHTNNTISLSSLSSLVEDEQCVFCDTSSPFLNKSTSLQHLHTTTDDCSLQDLQNINLPSSPSEASTLVLHTDSSQSTSGGSHLSMHSSLRDRFESVSTTVHSQSEVTEEDGFLNNPFSPVHLANPPAKPCIDHTGIIRRTSSQDTLTAFEGSPERDTTYLVSLTQLSEDSYPSDSPYRKGLIQQLRKVKSEDTFPQSKQDTIGEDFESEVVGTDMSAPDHLCEMETGPVDIPGENDVPHHSLHIGEIGDSPSSYLGAQCKDPPGPAVLGVEVSLLPGEERLGLNLMEDSEGKLRVKAIGPDTAADRSDLQCEDELLSVNNTSLLHTPLNIALNIMHEAMSTGRLVLGIHREKKSSKQPSSHTTLRPHDLLDMSRVMSGALPHSLNATTVLVNGNDTPDFGDSVILETLSSPDEPLECNRVAQEVTSESNNLPHSEQAAIHKGKGNRPFSAPNQSVNSTIFPAHKSQTLPLKSSSVSRLTKERTAAEREKRMANIHSNAQILLKYAQNRQSLHNNTGSPQKLSQSPAHLQKLFDSSDSLKHQRTIVGGSMSPELPHYSHSSSEVTIDNDSSASTPLNLRHISMDETRLASVIQMDSIWKQVESGDDSPSVANRDSGLAFDTQSNGKEDSPGVGYRDSGLAFDTQSNGEIDSNDDHESSRSVGAVKVIQDANKLSDSQSQILTTTEPAASTHVPSSTSITPLTASTPLTTSTQIRSFAPEAVPIPLTNSTPLTASTTITRSAPLLEDIKATGTENKERDRSASLNKDIDSLLMTLKSMATPEESSGDLQVLEDMLKSNNFKRAKKVHDQMRQLISMATSKPAVRRIVPGTQLLRQRLHCCGQSPETEELSDLLRKPHLQALLFCHDKVSTRDLYVPDRYFHQAAQDPVDIILSGSVYHFDTALSQQNKRPSFLSRDVPSGRKEGAVIVFLERTNKPLGATIYKQENSAYIGKLMRGCDAEASNVLREGDELLEVNGMPIWDKTTDHIVTLMSPGRTEEGDILVLTIIPVHDDSIDLEYETKYIRAHFNYNGRLDEDIPCKALGLAFQKGDILEISNQDDPNWWQARKVFDEGAESLPGLIPSRHLQQQREAMVRSYPFSFSSGSKPKKGLSSIFKRKKKVFYQNASSSSSVGVGDEVPTYEEVVQLEPSQSLCRPIVLVGAPRVGKRALIKELINSNPSRFSTVVSHTSRHSRAGEVEGRDYFFVTRDEFESDMYRDRFLEYGELKGTYYGTSFVSIKRIMESSQVPILDVHPQALKKLRYSGLQPYVIFIAAPRLERLQFTRRTVSEKAKKSLLNSSTTDEDVVYTEHELRQMLEESLLIEKQYGHYFDWIIVNDDFQVASDMLKEVIRRVDEEPQWIPTLWKYDRY